MIIDANVHITADGVWYGSNYNSSVDELLRQMDLASVDCAVSIPLPGSISNEDNQRICNAHPNRFIAGATFNPAEHVSAEVSGLAFKESFENAAFPVVKFHNRFGKYAARDDRFHAALEANARLAKPLIVMICGYLNGHNTGEYIEPAQFFFNLASTFSSTRFIVAHGGGHDILRVVETCKGLNNVYFDLSYTICRYSGSSVDDDLRWLCSKYDRRILWGSDFPEVTPADALQRINLLTEHLPQEKQDNIRGANLQQLYSL
jgi:predicted TIM-barrel fold metal-dependent hydrolase